MVPWDNLITGAVGVAGIVGTIVAARMTGKSQMAVAQHQADAQVAIAREERQQRRLEAAYLELLATITRFNYWVGSVYPPMTRTPEQYTMPPLPELPDIAKNEAMWTAYWSPRVEMLMREWEQSILKVQAAGAVIGTARSLEARGQPSQIDLAAKLMELEDLKQEAVDADKRVREQVRAELVGRDDGQAIEASPDTEDGPAEAGPSAPSV